IGLLTLLTRWRFIVASILNRLISTETLAPYRAILLILSVLSDIKDIFCFRIKVFLVLNK
ncbi:MAG: hypothetical protein PHC87_03790, partial [Actinomycetota bacterium]|nr:hypothetical protein [Actinomycetota bacterium]